MQYQDIIFEHSIKPLDSGKLMVTALYQNKIFRRIKVTSTECPSAKFISRILGSLECDIASHLYGPKWDGYKAERSHRLSGC